MIWSDMFQPAYVEECVPPRSELTLSGTQPSLFSITPTANSRPHLCISMSLKPCNSTSSLSNNRISGKYSCAARAFYVRPRGGIDNSTDSVEHGGIWLPSTGLLLSHQTLSSARLPLIQETEACQEDLAVELQELQELHVNIFMYDVLDLQHDEL